MAALFLKVPPVTAAIGSANHLIDAIAEASRAGTSFVFGYLGGGPLPFELKSPGNEFVLAFSALPIVLVMSVLTTLLFYWGILPPIIKGFSVALNRTMGVGGAVGLSTAANIFVGHVEAPLFIRPYLAKLSRSELFVVMTGGMAGIAGTVLVLYAQFLRDAVPDAAGHLIIASVLGAPVAVMIGQIMVPDEADTRTDSLDITEKVAESTDRRHRHRRHGGAGAVAQHDRHADRVRCAGAPRQRHARRLPRARRRADHPAAHARPRHGAGVLADRHSVGAGARRRRADGDQDRAERADRIPGIVEAAARHARSALAADHALCHVRLRQLRQPRHHDRRD